MAIKHGAIRFRVSRRGDDQVSGSALSQPWDQYRLIDLLHHSLEGTLSTRPSKGASELPNDECWLTLLAPPLLSAPICSKCLAVCKCVDEQGGSGCMLPCTRQMGMTIVAPFTRALPGVHPVPAATRPRCSFQVLVQFDAEAVELLRSINPPT